MAFRAVIFDIGGVLELTPRTGWQQQWALRLELSAEEFQQRLGPIWSRGSTGQVTLPEIEQQTAQALGLDQSQRIALMEDAWSEYLGTLNSQLAAYFAGLRPRFRTGILSNSFVGAREREQAAYGFEDLCDVVVYSHEQGMMKPDPRFYRLVCGRLGVSPEEAVFVDDVPGCVEGAIACGMHAIRFVDNGQLTAEIDRLLQQ